MGLKARIVFEDGDRSSSDRHYVAIFLGRDKIAESRSMSEKDCEKLCKRINDAIAKEREA
jgi:hypothetical protein